MKARQEGEQWKGERVRRGCASSDGIETLSLGLTISWLQAWNMNFRVLNHPRGICQAAERSGKSISLLGGSGARL